MDKANEEVLRECAVDYFNALKAYRKARAVLQHTEETVKANLAANKLYDTYHVHVEGCNYICFEYDPDFHDFYHIREEFMNLVNARYLYGDKNGR